MEATATGFESFLRRVPLGRYGLAGGWGTPANPWAGGCLPMGRQATPLVVRWGFRFGGGGTSPGSLAPRAREPENRPFQRNLPGSAGPEPKTDLRPQGVPTIRHPTVQMYPPEFGGRRFVVQPALEADYPSNGAGTDGRMRGRVCGGRI